MNAYVLDPARIAPSRSDANSNGHFPLTSGQLQSGTPRGFSLSNMPYMANSALQGGLQNFGGAGMAGFVGQGAWGGNALGGDPAGLHQPGVMRKGGGRNNNRSGPYDRRGNRGSRSGRLSPVRGMSNMFGAGGRVPPAGAANYVPPGHPAANMIAPNPFLDAMGTGNPQQDMAPREAVQGRSLKSYEDLDAVDGSGGGELNY